MSTNINHSIKTAKVSDYLVLFKKAQDNFELVCKEYKNSALCQKRKRRKRVSTIN